MNKVNKKQLIRSGWIITWKWIGHHVKKNTKEEVVLILKHTIPIERVRKYIEILHIASMHPEDKFYCARNLKNYPFDIIARTIPYKGEYVTIQGVNPYLEARRVKNIRLLENGNGIRIMWDDIYLN